MTPLARRRLLWSIALAGTAAAVIWVGGQDDEGVVVAGEPRDGERSGGKSAAAAPTLALEQLDNRAFGEMKADLLAAKSWYVAPPPPPPPKPTPPPLPFTYAGRMIEEGGTSVFLARANRHQIVRVGDRIDGAWRVDDIAATVMTLTYLPLNESQTLALGAAP